MSKDTPKDILTICRSSNEKEFDLIKKIITVFKIKNVEQKGDTMLLDLTNVKPNEGSKGKPVPEGNYNAYLATSILQTTKDGTGKFIRTMWKITEEPFVNRTVFHNFNIETSSEEARKIAIGAIRYLCDLNKRTNLVIKSAEDLVGLKSNVTIKIKEDATYGNSNFIAKFKQWTGAADFTPPPHTSTSTYTGHKTTTPW